MLKLQSVYYSDDGYEAYAVPGTVQFLYDLLKERQPHESISHKEMPPFEIHAKFVMNRLYKDWQIIAEDGEPVGAIYLTVGDEIGISILKKHRGGGVGEWAVRKMMERHPDVKQFLANINPRNEPSLRLFEKLGFRILQETYAYEPVIPGTRTGVHPSSDNDEDAGTRPG